MPTKSQILRKDPILSGLMETRQSILVEASKLSAKQQDQVFLGIWSIKDVLAHMSGWEHTNLRAAKAILKGKLPSFYKHRDHEWQTCNAILVKKHTRASMPELLTAIRESQEQLMKFLRALPAEQFNKDFGVRFRGYKVTIQHLLEAEQEDEQTHLEQIVDFIKDTR